MKHESNIYLWARARSLRETRRQLERLNSLMQDRNRVAVSVMGDAKRVWSEIWDACLDPTNSDQIICSVRAFQGKDNIPAGGWPELREKLHLLGHYLEYASRLMEEEVAEILREQGESSEVRGEDHEKTKAVET